MLMKSSISFSKNTLFSQSVASHLNLLVLDSCGPASCEPRPSFSLTAGWHLLRCAPRLRVCPNRALHLSSVQIARHHRATQQFSKPPPADCCTLSRLLLPANDRHCVLPGRGWVR